MMVSRPDAASWQRSPLFVGEMPGELWWLFRSLPPAVAVRSEWKQTNLSAWQSPRCSWLFRSGMRTSLRSAIKTCNVCWRAPPVRCRMLLDISGLCQKGEHYAEAFFKSGGGAGGGDCCQSVGSPKSAGKRGIYCPDGWALSFRAMVHEAIGKDSAAEDRTTTKT